MYFFSFAPAFFPPFPFPLCKTVYRAPERNHETGAKSASGDRRHKKTRPHTAAAPLRRGKNHEPRERIKKRIPEHTKPAHCLPENIERQLRCAERRAGKESERQLEKLPGRRLCHLPKQPRPEAAPHRDIGIAQFGNIPHNEKIAGIHR